MKSKDTVMSGEQRSEIIQCNASLWCPTKGEFLDEVGEVIAKAQAELSFKAGREEAIAECLGDMAYNQIKQDGIKEVLEWIDNTFPNSITKAQMMATNTWQAKLKEWGTLALLA